jgi:mannose-6-phosphate isomerase-like protein (cupin superfamily)
MHTINIELKFSQFNEMWSPKILGEVNDSGEFVWHHHDHEDEMFMVIRGKLRMKFRDHEEIVNPGEFIIVPRGVEHLPVSDEETQVLLFEPKTTLNTGNVRNERTLAQLETL